MHKFIKQLSDALAIIESTVTAKKHFKEIVSKYPSLGLAPVHKWAGVGAVWYFFFFFFLNVNYISNDVHRCFYIAIL